MRRENFFRVGEEVAEALAGGRAVTALESTIISHGMPWPENVETALAVEAVVREHGAVPATVGILDGRLVVGLGREGIARMGDPASKPVKVSRRDLPVVLAKGLCGATTVSATMIGARLAGVPLFATGGIGGVHRDVLESFDVSADLGELARTEVAVVCAGAKAILDIGRTLEALEALGVPVIGYGTDAFPAFYTPRSGFDAPWRCDTPGEVARVLAAKRALGLGGGVLVVNPVPEGEALDAAVMDAAIGTALDQAAREGVKGKAVTPYLLAKVVEATDGASLKANVALIRHNAALAARIAAALSEGSVSNRDYRASDSGGTAGEHSE